MKKFWKNTSNNENSHKVDREFPDDQFDRLDSKTLSITRRNFFKVMGSSAILAGVATSCGKIRKPKHEIHPYVKMPEKLIPGNPLYYATSHELNEEVTGLLAENHEGRPTKIEGNPLYPANKGVSNVFTQASVLDLYDPDRFSKVLVGGKPSNTTEVDRWIDSLNLAGNQGEGLGILLGYSLSPTVYRLLGEIQKEYPSVKIYRQESVDSHTVYQGVYNISGSWARPIVNYKKADIVVSLNSDFLGLDSGSIQANRDFMGRRRVENGRTNRLYQFENTFSVTGGVADHRFRVKRSEVELVAYGLLRQFYLKGVIRTNKYLIEYLEKALVNSAVVLKDSEIYKNISTIADDLSQNPRRSVVVAGVGASPLVHSLVYYINHLIGAPVKYTVHPYADRKYVRESSVEAITRLAGDLDNNVVSDLMVLGGDPVFNGAYTDSLGGKTGFSDLLKKANVLHLSNLPCETSSLAKVVVPRSHYLENWSDQVSLEGVVSIVQPLITPINESFSDIEMLAKVLGSNEGAIDLVKATHGSKLSWKKALHDGVAYRIKGLARNSALKNIEQFTRQSSSNLVLANSDLEVTFDLDYTVYDGRLANNAWLQELPDPVTKITWGNVIIISHALAEKEGLKSSDVVSLFVNGKSLEGPVWVLPGQADLSISLKLGYGQSVTGKLGEGVGFDANLVRDGGKEALQGDIRLTKLGREEKVATVQGHWNVADEIFEGGASSNSQNDRPLYRQADLEEYESNPKFAKEAEEVTALKEHHDRYNLNKTDEEVPGQNMSIFKEKVYDAEYQWGMAIDLSTCTGCNACTIACQAENNIPVVGKEMVLMGREMHWIRIDRYFEGDPVSPQMVAQPVNCMQCEQAPCEQVCPVAATVHSEEGLNDMVYNRCIGTRFCSNNCPYKVRRFNYFDFHQRSPHAKKKVSSHIFELFKEPAETLQMQFNPDVTVRMRGVMEKCTYCTQRINRSRVEARNEGRQIRDGEIKTACEQACPTESIVFGNLQDKQSKVSVSKKRDRNYQMLAQLNLKPRTSYLAAIKNPNKNIVSGS